MRALSRMLEIWAKVRITHPETELDQVANAAAAARDDWAQDVIHRLYGENRAPVTDGLLAG